MKASTYLTVTPKFRPVNYYRPNGEKKLDSLRVSKATSNLPTGPGVVVKVTLDIPEAAFEPLRPVAEITVGLGDVTVNVDVEAPDGDS